MIIQAKYINVGGIERDRVGSLSRDRVVVRVSPNPSQFSSNVQGEYELMRSALMERAEDADEITLAANVLNSRL